jgi:putative phage-type endonuclease
VSTATALRRVTPAAGLLLPATADRSEWLAARRGGIGSSDIAAIMGVSKSNPRRVFYDKVGALPADEDAGEKALWGVIHEEPIAREWARRNRSVVRRVGLVANLADPWMMCTLDRRCTECPLNPEVRESCALEVKTTDKALARNWRLGPPDYVLAQVLWQIRVTGYDHIHVAVLIGGNDPRQYVVRLAGNEQLVDDIVAVASRFWHGNVLARVVPELTGEEDPDDLVDMYHAMHPEREGVVNLAGHPSAYEDLLDYERHRLAEKAAKKRKNAAKARMVVALGGAAWAMFDGDDAYGFETSFRRTPNLERLAERWPEAYADCVQDKPSPRLTIAPKYRRKEGDSVVAA